MKLTVLGNNGPFPAAGGACSGYLLQDEGKNLLFDCGNGVLSNLQKIISFDQLDAIILTHLHNDHISDMLVLQYAVDLLIKKGRLRKPIKVFAPPQPQEVYNRLNLPGVFVLEPINQSLELKFGNLLLGFKEMRHPVQCFAISVTGSGRRFVYSGDTSWNEGIIEFSRNSDLLMLDAGLLAKDKTSENVPHLTAEECGIIAKEAGVKQLLLTHFWPEYNINELLQEAKKNFVNTRPTEMMMSIDI